MPSLSVVHIAPKNRKQDIMETTRELTREEWLTNAAELMAPLFESAGITPKPVRISVGFPANKRAGKAGKVIGECHYMASDGVPQIFIHPVLTDGDRGPLPTLAHELAHAYLPVGTGHKRPFAKLVEALGLTGKPTATLAGETFNTDMQAIADILGEYPHASLDASDIKKQGTRMIKIQCNGEIHTKPLIWRTPQSSIDRTDIIRCWNGECDSMPTVG